MGLITEYRSSPCPISEITRKDALETPPLEFTKACPAFKVWQAQQVVAGMGWGVGMPASQLGVLPHIPLIPSTPQAAHVFEALCCLPSFFSFFSPEFLPLVWHDLLFSVFTPAIIRGAQNGPSAHPCGVPSQPLCLSAPQRSRTRSDGQPPEGRLADCVRCGRGQEFFSFSKKPLNLDGLCTNWRKPTQS